MTRLVPKDIAKLGLNWSNFDRSLFNLTGQSLLSLAAQALDLKTDLAQQALANKSLAIVPNSSGEGLIEGFSEALKRIAQRLGCQAFITAPDALGLKQAQSRQADLLLTSDDHDYHCLNLKSSYKAPNGQATGLGFAQALFFMAQAHLQKQRVLVIGAGPVGWAAAQRLSRLGAQVIVHDLIAQKAQALIQSLPGAQIYSQDLGPIPNSFSLILDASSSKQLFPPELIPLGANISAPGMPFSFRPSQGYRLWAEPLATGTAVMLLMAALNLELSPTELTP
ncbi:MAG: 3-methylornithyl-N6-L-lysine dehydrogenase PylD [Deltaproteobacteria bacterium]|jgi:pyrrolysine biosynthesis protein PylD|nr:3-methylornithyl-N6-L-lysine dehydrogenase PylD [Deltaproteobacteria bacterium]